MKKNRKIKTIDMIYIGLSVALIAVCSWISIPIVVPFTLQTLGICLISALFGAKKGVAATIVYILLGFIGIPVFSGFKGGVGVLFGATGGYIIGFIFTALIIGIVSDKTDGKLWKLILGMAAGIIVLYIFGTVWFALVYEKGVESISILTILSSCVFPFILPDIAKIIIASILTNRLKKYVRQRKE